ncbi:putative bifunctional diguanylate cyclase/phosphodiesterase [Silvibacterium sp.]|uniref:putative bifunctional diguanylate cyclase/phosphodiesterase n=1 Tax=Silvibacterium sp. TaxID=1964179 RepID=UPI0039E60C34
MHLAFHDSLTGLGNRSFLFENLQTQLNAPARRDKSSLYLMHVGLDRFQSVNELFGYQNGDALLKEAAERIEDLLSDEDIAVRLGADEFCILFGRINSQDQARRMALRLLQLMEKPYTLQGIEFPVTVSIGVCEVESRYTDGEDLLRAGATALERAKRQGGNCYVFYDQAIFHETLRAIETTLQLRTAVEQNQLELYYQPLVDMRDLSIYGVESLVRWNHPTRGLLPPGAFIELAEEAGSIIPMGVWAMEQTVADIRTMTQQGGRSLVISLNVSSRQLDDPDFLRHVKKLVSNCGIDPSLLQLEITESVFVRDPQRVGYLLQDIRALGVKIALDDFGTGYSSLSYLSNFPIDVLKIDQSFVRNMMHHRLNLDIVKMLIELSRKADMRVVGEGVETEEQAMALLHAGCNFGQGYLYSRPVPLSNLVLQLRQGIRLPEVKVQS